MVIFNSYVKLPEGTTPVVYWGEKRVSPVVDGGITNLLRELCTFCVKDMI